MYFPVLKTKGTSPFLLFWECNYYQNNNTLNAEFGFISMGLSVAKPYKLFSRHDEQLIAEVELLSQFEKHAGDLFIDMRHLYWKVVRM